MVIVALSVIGCLLLTPLAAFAQPLDLKMPGREPRSGRFDDLYPHRPPVPYAPAFLGPLSKDMGASRAGIAVWTVPNPAVGSRATADPENTGWLGFGFALEWGGSARPKAQN